MPFRDFGAWQQQATIGYTDAPGEFERAIDDLIGVKGMSRPSKDELNRHFDFLLEHPFEWDLWSLKEDFSRTRHLRLADLGSACDLAVLSQLNWVDLRRVSVLEIGGGYGRLAEALIRNLGDKIPLEIHMIDVVPSSLDLANAYLTSSGISTVLAAQVGIEKGSFVRLSRAENLIRVQGESIDLVVNVESFQEMTPEWVSWYLEEVERVTHVGSYFYQSNSFGYKNIFSLELGRNWVLEETFIHPRHWTDSHRTELWRRVS